MKKIIVIVLFIITFLTLLIVSIDVTLNKDTKLAIKLNSINLDDIDNLMVVAHPDDETLWGGVHLLSDNYLVVCVTCVDKERIEEFKNVMKASSNEYIILGYPDKTNNQRDNWNTSYDGIKLDLEEIVDYKKWNTIVTHNPDGEYGHIHHMLVSEIMTNISPKDRLYYFNKYYTKEDIEIGDKSLKRITNNELMQKEELLKLYPSQGNIINNHRQTIIYERFIPYNEWYK